MTALIVPPGPVIEQPGIYDIPHADYLADPTPGGSLSSSEARELLACPAKFYWRRTNRVVTHKPEFDFGHAAHALVLGVGDPIVVVEADDWRTKAAKEQRDEAYAAGHTPVLVADWEVVQAMATALRTHPIAAALLAPGTGKAEQSLFWRDVSGIMRRARLDWLPNPGTRRLIISDYKTARDASNDAFARAAASYGYHAQAAWYLDGVRALCDEPNPAFLHIAQEKEPPYLVNVVELDEQALDIGAAQNRRAIDRYQECVRTGTWPGYSDGIEPISLPQWAVYQHERKLDSEGDALAW